MTITKPQIRLRKEWGALEPDPGMFKYDNIREEYYRATLHHGTDAPAKPMDVARILRQEQLGHMELGYGDISYHYMIDPWGRIYAGRNIAYRGCHVGGANTGNLGICFVMHGNNAPLSKEAHVAAVALLTWWCSYLRINPAEIKGHRDYLPTACPGDLVYPSVAKIRAEVAKNLRG